jgi:hypothetical protein
MTGHAFLYAEDCGRICLVLFHSLWQMGLVAMLAWLLGRTWRKRSVEWAYGVHVAALVAGLVAMPTTYWLLADRAAGTQPAVSAVELPKKLSNGVNSITVAGHEGGGITLNTLSNGQLVLNTVVDKGTTQGHYKRFAPWIVGIYAFGAVMMLVRLGVGIARTERMRRRAVQVGSGDIAQRVAKLATAWR